MIDPEYYGFRLITEKENQRTWKLGHLILIDLMGTVIIKIHNDFYNRTFLRIPIPNVTHERMAAAMDIANHYLEKAYFEDVYT